MQRLFIPLVLLLVAAGAWYGSEELGNTDVTPPVVEELTSSETPVLSARRMPEFLVQRIAADALKADLDAVVEAEPGGTCLHVTDGSEVLYSHQGDFGLTPASVQKLVTGFGAIQELEPTHRFETRLMALSQPENGVLNGNLYLVGGGDPLLMTQDYVQTFGEQPQIHTPIEDLADDLVRSGLRQITGGVHAVEVLYDQDRYPDGWPERFAEQGQSGPLGALMINDGFTEYPPDDLSRLLGAQPTASDDPALHAAALFDDLLEARQVVIASGQRNVSRADLDTFQADLIELGRIESPPVSEVVRQMLTQSDNTTAELLLKAIGLSESNAGTTSVGARALVGVLEDAGLGRLAVPPVDGSGLDSNNKLACSYVVELLQYARPGTPFGDAFPVAGEDGTLRDRFNESAAAGRVHAKTGSLNEVTSLAGWVEADEEKILQFALITNLTGGRQVTDELVDLQEILGEALVAYPVGPSAADVAPRGATTIAAEALGLEADDVADAVPVASTPGTIVLGGDENDTPDTTGDDADSPGDEIDPNDPSGDG